MSNSKDLYMSHVLNSLKGGYIEDFIGDDRRGNLEGVTRSLGCSCCRRGLSLKYRLVSP